MGGFCRHAGVSRRLLAAAFLVAPTILSQPGLAASSRHPAASYTITDLGTLGGSYTTSGAKAINASGEITGWAEDPATGNSVVMKWSAGVMTNLGTLGGNSGVGLGIDAKGDIAGYSTNATTYRAFLYTGKKLKNIGDLGGGYADAYAINRAGDIAGSSPGANGNVDPFLYRRKDRTMIDLGNLGSVTPSEWNAALGINDHGELTGISWDGDVFLAFLWKNGKMKSLGTLGGLYSEGYAINNNAQVTGVAYTARGEAHAFLWSAGAMTDLGLIPGSVYTWGRGINASGEVVGYAEMDNGYHAFVYTSGTLSDLNDLIPQGSGWVLEFANGVNDSGQIAGEGVLNGVEHGYLLTPN